MFRLCVLAYLLCQFSLIVSYPSNEHRPYMTWVSGYNGYDQHNPSWDNAATENWDNTTHPENPPVNRIFSAGCTIGDYMFVYGGLFGNSGVNDNLGYDNWAQAQYYLDDLFSYNFKDSRWTKLRGSVATQWTNQPNPSPSYDYGALNTESDNVNPGSRFGHSAVCDDKYMWVFGGAARDHSGYVSSTLFRYNPETRYWSCRYGCNSNAVPPYLGGGANYYNYHIGDSIPIPSRRFHSMTRDSQGNIWIFGGELIHDSNSGPNSDLWKFSAVTSQFHYMGGIFGGTGTFVADAGLQHAYDGASIYGEKGTAYTPPAFDTTQFYNPPPRMMHSAVMDKQDVMWIYGGWYHVFNFELYLSYMAGFSEKYFLNDVWAYNTTGGTWTWMSGNSHQIQPSSNSPDTAASRGHFGTIDDPDNEPAPRFAHSAVITNDRDAFYVIGGYSMPMDQNGYTACSDCNWGATNEIWKYNTTTSKWKFEFGTERPPPNEADAMPGSWGTLGQRDENNVLPYAAGQVAVFDNITSVYLFGGGWLGSSNTGGSVYGPNTRIMNNLWRLEWDLCNPAIEQYDCMNCPDYNPNCRACTCSFAPLWDRLRGMGFTQWGGYEPAQ